MSDGGMGLKEGFIWTNYIDTFTKRIRFMIRYLVRISFHWCDRCILLGIVLGQLVEMIRLVVLFVIRIRIAG
jgi:hypothetical protein